MLVIIVQIISPIREIEDRISALVFLTDLLLWDFKFHFGSDLKTKNLE